MSVMKQFIVGVILGTSMMVWCDYWNSIACDSQGHTSFNFTKYECKKVGDK